MQHFSNEATRIVAHLQAVLKSLDDLKSQPERQAVYDSLAAHLRSAAPMSLLAPPPLASTDDALIDLGAGQVIRLRVLDGRLSLFVCESAAHDASVVLGEMQREQLRAALGVVR